MTNEYRLELFHSLVLAIVQVDWQPNTTDQITPPSPLQEVTGASHCFSLLKPRTKDNKTDTTSIIASTNTIGRYTYRKEQFTSGECGWNLAPQDSSIQMLEDWCTSSIRNQVNDVEKWYIANAWKRNSNNQQIKLDRINSAHMPLITVLENI